jgi:nicotinic acid phosphoribosyltransferase
MTTKPIHIAPNHPPRMVRARPDLSRGFDCRVMYRKLSVKVPGTMAHTLSQHCSQHKRKTADWVREAITEKLEQENAPC